MSVVVSCYRQAPFVVAALESVAAQEYTDWELIVTDDGSDDGSPEIIRDWADQADRSVRLLLGDTNRGLTRVLNDALTSCRGEFVAYLGGDDRWTPMKLARQVAVLDGAAATVPLVYCDARVIDRDGVETAPSFLTSIDHRPVPEGDVFHRLLTRNFIVASSVVFRRSSLDAIGGWDPDLPYEDWDLVLRLAVDHPVAVVDEPLVDFRVHDGSATRRRFSILLEARLRILEKWLGHDAVADEIILAQLRVQSWRLYKVHPDLGRPHVAVAYARWSGPAGWLRHLVATHRMGESAFGGIRRLSRIVRR